MKVKSESEVAQSCPTLSDPVDCSPPGSSVHGIFQARVLEWGAIAFSVLLATWPIIKVLGCAKLDSLEAKRSYLVDISTKKSYPSGTSLALRWLRLCTPNAGSKGLIPGKEMKIPQATEHYLYTTTDEPMHHN